MRERSFNRSLALGKIGGWGLEFDSLTVVFSFAIFSGIRLRHERISYDKSRNYLPWIELRGNYPLWIRLRGNSLVARPDHRRSIVDIPEKTELKTGLRLPGCTVSEFPGAGLHLDEKNGGHEDMDFRNISKVNGTHKKNELTYESTALRLVTLWDSVHTPV
ncbi:hypothetical protein V8E54_001748 [Elaphomyces granulatus]